MTCRILLLTHGGWGKMLISSAHMIIGTLDFVDEITLQPIDTLKEYTSRVEQYYQNLVAQSNINQLLIITDIFGGTPNNVAAVLAKQHSDRITVFTGLNLPLLLESCSQTIANDQIDYAILQKNCEHSVFNISQKIKIGE